MQKISKYMMMAALALVGTMTTGCSNEDLAKEAPQPKIDNNTVTLTTTISLDGSASTRALDAQGKKTFAAGDQVAIYYQNTSDVAKMAVTTALQASDITNNGKTAKFTVTLKSPKAGGQLRYVYPASMAETEITSVDSNENISSEFLLQQDGTLETLASKFDLAIYDGSLSSKALLPTTATLKNQLAIAELTIKDYNGNTINNKITKLDIQMNGNGYALTRPDTDNPTNDPIYVAMFPSPSGSTKDSITVTATTNDGTEYERDFKFNFAANNIYPIAVKTFKVVDVSTLTIPEGENDVEYTAQNGDMLTGTIANYVLIRIAENANVALKNLTIDYKAPPGSNFYFHNSGITCIGNATIILEGTNKVKAFEDDFPGISAATNNSTLTIKGDGSLEAIGQMGGAGIGGGIGGNCGNIVIESGSITATGGNNAAGIGSGYNNSCGNILISGGTVKATGGNNAAGIGTGDNGTCGSITITNGVKEVIAKKGINADCSIGKGNDNSSCGKVTILGVEYWNGSGYVNDEGRIYLQDPDLKIIP